MIAKAKLRYLRMSPRKTDQVVRLIRGKPVGYALSVLTHLNKKASLPVNKLLKSALSNAESKGLNTKDLSRIFVSKVTVSPGPTLKRYKSAAFGRATIIRKRTSHIEIELEAVSKNG
ncbi:50S ribosomal protein L22 [Candidatus Omnitrophota bacterium]